MTGAGNPSMDGTYTLERNGKRKYGGAPAYRKQERGGAGIEYEYLCLRRGDHSPIKEAHGSKHRKVCEVLVQDAGTSCVNGLYKQISQTNDGAPMYIKKGQYKGNQSATFLIWRSANNIWYICLSGVREPVTFY